MSALLRLAARNLVRVQFDVRPGDGVLVTTDERTGKTLVEALSGAVVDAGARPVIVVIPQLPFQGALADPYIPDTLSAAAAASDHWFDLCFPYLAGSSMHAAAMQAARSRYGLLATAGARSFARLYGGVDLDALLDYQVALVDYLDARAGEGARFTCPLGSDLRFTLDRVKLRRERVARSPGLHTVPGAQSLYPVPKSVSGRLVLQALFDEHYRRLRRPITIEVDGGISGFSGAAAEDAAGFDRALRRAGADGGYGGLIHFTFAFHPAARVTGRHFIEDIRALGSNAVGMGLPWWEAGGGENHPDGVVLDQSLWIGADLIVDAGRVVGPESLTSLHQRVARVFV